METSIDHFYRTSVCCFSGPRPKHLVGYNYAGYKDLVEHITELVTVLYTDYGIRKFISGGAQGFDTCAFWAVDKVKRANPYWDITNAVYVPFPNQCDGWAKVGAFSSNDYNKMLRLADFVNYVCKIEPAEYRQACLMLDDRNQAMVNDSCVVIALRNEGDYRKGGTMNCINYALRNGVDVVYVPHVVGNQQVIMTGDVKTYLSTYMPKTLSGA